MNSIMTLFLSAIVLLQSVTNKKKSKFSESNSFMFDCQKKIFIMVIMMHKSGNGFISPICPKSTRK